jgi:hypothetical protein
VGVLEGERDGGAGREARMECARRERDVLGLVIKYMA